jgi:hypothetical protein
MTGIRQPSSPAPIRDALQDLLAVNLIVTLALQDGVSLMTIAGMVDYQQRRIAGTVSPWQMVRAFATWYVLCFGSRQKAIIALQAARRDPADLAQSLAGFSPEDIALLARSRELCERCDLPPPPTDPPTPTPSPFGISDRERLRQTKPESTTGPPAPGCGQEFSNNSFPLPARSRPGVFYAAMDREG